MRRRTYLFGTIKVVPFLVLLEIYCLTGIIYIMKTKLFLYLYEDWSEVGNFNPRSLEPIILKDGEKESILNDINRFESREAWYIEKGIPYHRGYLLWGIPGTGKSSLISALAKETKRSIYYVKLNELTDRSLITALGYVESHSMLVFEDIDCMKSAEAREDKEDKDKQASDIWSHKR